MATPQYKVVEPCFIQPHLLKPGSIIETEGSPGPHLMPLNAEARAKWDEWLHEEVDELDKDGAKTGKKIKPHLRYQVFTPSDADRPEATTVHIVAEPPREMAGGADLTLGMSQLRQPTADVRPPPAPFSEVPTDNITGETKILHAAPIKSKV